MGRILSLARAEVLHVVRDRTTMSQVLLAPLVQLIILANAATFKIRDTPTWVVDRDQSTTSRALVDRFNASGYFHLRGHSVSFDPANDAMLRGRVTMVVGIPPDFEKSLVRTGRASVQLQLNAEKGAAAGIVQSYAADIITAYARSLGSTLRPGPRTVRAADVPPVRGAPSIELSTRSWYNPTLNYTHYMVPGILVSLVTIIGTLLTAQNIAREKELGTLEQLNVTPITRSQFITAKLMPFWALGMIDLVLGLLVGKLIFGIPMRGSLLLLFVAAGVYLVVALAIGLWISTIVDTQQQAMFVTFFVLVVYILMSGLFTPVESMPHWVQVVSEVNPMRHFVQLSRAVLVKGAGLREVGVPLGILTAYAGIMLTLAVRQYSKRAA